VRFGGIIPANRTRYRSQTIRVQFGLPRRRRRAGDLCRWADLRVLRRRRAAEPCRRLADGPSRRRGRRAAQAAARGEGRLGRIAWRARLHPSARPRL